MKRSRDSRQQGWLLPNDNLRNGTGVAVGGQPGNDPLFALPHRTWLGGCFRLAALQQIIDVIDARFTPGQPCGSFQRAAREDRAVGRTMT